ncbi:MAG TPA: acetate--CoA ligase family protein [Streptosporangiaceae bacterium]
MQPGGAQPSGAQPGGDVAAAAGGSLERFFSPRSIAIIGASGSPHTLSARPLRILKQHGYPGTLYPVNPRYAELGGLTCYPDVGSLPEPPDLALVLVSAAAVPGVLDQCGEAGVGGVVVISSGFAEQQEGGTELRARLSEVLDRHQGLRLAGPNSEGFINVYGAVPATFSPAADPDRGMQHLLPGPVAVVSQSGGLGFALFNDGQTRGLGFSYVISAGNEDDLSLLDYVDYLVTDERVGVILLFVEGLRHAGRLAATAARARAAGKPLVAAKAGRSSAGQRATWSHSAHLAGRDEIYQAVLRRCGIATAMDQEELVDLGMAFARAPRPAGRRVGVLTYSGGAGVWAADALEAEGLQVPELSAALAGRIRELIPAYGSAANPVDVTAQVVQTAGGLAPVLELLACSDEVDAVVVTTTLSSAALLAAEEAALGQVVRKAGKPVLLYSYTRPAAESVEILTRMGLAWFTSGRRVARALRALTDYGSFTGADRAAAGQSAGPRPTAPRTCTEQASLAAMPPDALASVQAAPVGPLTEWRAKALLRAAGLVVPEGELAFDVAAARAAADRLGYPVAVKAQSAALPHKTEAGAVALGLGSPAEVTAAISRMTSRVSAAIPGAELDGWLVERMCPAGTEMILGIVRDQALGPAVVAGFGGIFAEILADVACLPAPMTEAEALAGLAGLRGWPLLAGARGRPPADVSALARLVQALGDLADQCPRITELDLNPVIVGAAGQGAWVADAAGWLAEMATG